MSDEVYVCEVCRGDIDPAAGATVFAVELAPVSTFRSASSTTVDGNGVMFHGRHWPTGSRRYRRVERPEEFC